MNYILHERTGSGKFEMGADRSRAESELILANPASHILVEKTTVGFLEPLLCFLGEVDAPRLYQIPEKGNARFTGIHDLGLELQFQTVLREITDMVVESGKVRFRLAETDDIVHVPNPRPHPQAIQYFVVQDGKVMVREVLARQVADRQALSRRLAI